MTISAILSLIAGLGIILFIIYKAVDQKGLLTSQLKKLRSSNDVVFAKATSNLSKNIKDVDEKTVSFLKLYPRKTWRNLVIWFAKVTHKVAYISRAAAHRELNKSSEPSSDYLRNIK